MEFSEENEMAKGSQSIQSVSEFGLSFSQINNSFEQKFSMAKTQVKKPFISL